MDRKKWVLLLSMIGVAAAVVLLLVLLPKEKKDKENFSVVTSFYPVYLLAESVAQDVEGVTVSNLTENHSGCLHDYTLTTGDMKQLSEADVFLTNGGGMELFLSKVAGDYPQLTMVDTSEGFSFLEGVAHDHEHEDEEHADHAQEDADHEHAEHDGDEAEHEHADHDEDDADHLHVLNSHIWLSIDGYLYQLSRVEEALVKADPTNAAKYHENAADVREALNVLREEYRTASTQLSGLHTVVFHEGFVYLMEMLSIEVAHCLPMDADTQLSAGEAAEIADECSLHGITVMFAEESFVQTISDTFSKETGAKVIALDAVAGETEDSTGSALTRYCEAMRNNLRIIEQAFSAK